RSWHALEQVAHLHEGLEGVVALLQQADALMADALPELRHVVEQPFDAQALQTAEERLAQLRAALRRHQVDEAGLIRLMRDWQERLQGLDTAGWDEQALEAELAEAEAAYLRSAERLHKARKDAALRLQAALRPLLDGLSLQGMQVRFRIEEADEFSAHGRDRIAIELMANPGEPWRPLSTTISGGELSRFVLALKGCDALRHAAPLAVFDEVDTGIGGETAWHVGRLLADMGRKRQVLVISHLPQVASCAAHHVRIEKRLDGGRTHTVVECLDETAREQEIARMLGGGDTEGLQHARAFLRRGGVI
ncbi:MAG: DNA repair protein RecN, partial [Zetaproteobacteria bacterium]